MSSLQSLRSTFRSGKTLNVDWRIGQLQALKKMVFENQDILIQAVREDLRKPAFETIVGEISMLFEDLELALENIHEWVKPRKAGRPNLLLWGMDKVEMKAEPYGLMLIMVPWNYPLQLSLVPLVGAIAAGNCVVIKPSELAPSTEKILADLIPKYLDPAAFMVYTGGIPETQKLLENKFDHILYTGSTAVGKIVMAAAARHLTPVTLELGGKSPCIVDETADLYVAARRIMWGKLINSGQSCVAPDYVLVEESAEAALLEQMKKAVQGMYGDNPQQSADFGRVINLRHFDRISALLKDGEVVFGGQTDRRDLYIAPTVLRNVTMDDPVMQDEIFGPVLPVLTYRNVEEAVELINDRDKPLALYVFSKNSKTISYVEERTSSGAFLANDTMTHVACNTLPFGGVGPSGIGGYHGAHSFEAFSHLKPCLRKYPGLEFFNDVRMAPYEPTKLRQIQWLLGYPTKLHKSHALSRILKLVGAGFLLSMVVALFYRYQSRQ